MSTNNKSPTRVSGGGFEPALQYGSYTKLSEHERFCTCCERDLSGHAFRWLELDQRGYVYHDFGDVPEDQSQGWFPFGLTCARKLVAKEAARRAKGGAA